MRFSRKIYVIPALIVGFCFPLGIAQEAAQMPCSSPPAAQFDFWLGEWDLTWSDSLKGSNTINKIMNGCVILEQFDGHPAMEFRGMSVSVFGNDGKWHQTWVDNQGGYLDFDGGFSDGKMILSRQATRGSETILQRMVFFNISENELDWDWQRSDDDGRTWKSLWKIHYDRKK